jgi:hypothetical protein
MTARMAEIEEVPDPPLQNHQQQNSLPITKPPDLKNTQMSNFFKYSKILETAIAPHTSFLSEPQCWIL